MAFINVYSDNVRGALTFTGNTAGLSKLANANLAGTIASIGAFTSLGNTIVGDFPQGTTLNIAQNGSAAQLVLPVGAKVVYAEIIWSGNYFGQNPNNNVQVNISGVLNNPIIFTTPLTSTSVSPDITTSQQSTLFFTVGTAPFQGGYGFYVRSKDVTSLVQAAGAGTYSVQGIPGIPEPIDATTSGTNGAGWTLAVAYEDSTMPYRNLNIWVGAEIVDRNTNPIRDVPISGFNTPPTGPVTARLLVSSLEGDASADGDQLLFGSNIGSLTAMSGPNNPVDNFFASQINNDSGNLDTTGTFGNRNANAFTRTNISAGRQGWDITNVNASSQMTNNQTSAIVRFTTVQSASTDGESYMPNVLGTQIDIATPVITINKVANKTAVVKGDQIIYTLTITNTGTIGTDNFTLLDDLAPTGTTIDLSSIIINGATGPIVNNSTINGLSIELGAIAIGQVITVQFAINTTTSTPSPILNKATTEYSFTPVPTEPPIIDLATSNTTSTNGVTVTQSKTSSHNEVLVGDILTYTVNIDNSTSNAPITNVFVYDPLQTGTSYVANTTVIGANPPINSNPSVLPGVPIGTVAAGATQKVTFAVKVDSIPSPNPIQNTAQITYTVDNTTKTQNTNTTNVLVRSPDISVVKSVDKSLARVGEKLTYTTVITNTGDTPLTNIIFNDAPPLNTTYDGTGVTIGGNLYPTLNPNSSINFIAVPVVQSPFPLQPGQTITVSYTVDITSQPLTNQINNTADITFEYLVDGITRSSIKTSNVASTQIYVINQVKTVNKAVAEPGDVLTYTTTITSTIPGVYGSNIIFIDNVPAGTTLIPGSINVVGSTFTNNSTSSQVNLNFGTNFPNNPIIVNFQVTVNQGVSGEVLNTSQVSIGSSTTTSNQVTTEIVSPSISKTTSKTFVTVGEIFTYTVTIDNTGNNAPLTNVFIFDPLQAGTSYVPTTTSINGAPPINSNPSIAPGINVGTVAANTTAIVTFNVIVDSIPNPNPILNTATMNYQVGGVDKSINSNQTQVTVRLAELQTIKAVDKAFADVGDILTYTITLTNNGNSPAINTVVTDMLPNGTSLVTGSVSSSVAFTGTNPETGITLTNPIQSGETVTVSYRVTVDVIPNPNPITNIADVSYSYVVDPINNPVNVNTTTNQVTTQVNNANLVAPGNFVKAVDKAFANVGDILNYTITVKNTGNTIANNVVITDPIPNGTSYVSGSLTGSVLVTGTPASGVSVTNGIAPGQTITMNYQVKVDVITNPNPIPNTASVAYTYTVDPSKPNGATGSGNTNTVTTQVNNANLVAPGNFVKAVDKAFADVGDIITYTITVKNTGNTIANNVVITDPIPNGTSYVSGSLTGSVPVTGTPSGGVNITNGIALGQTITISYQVKVDVIPVPNPIPNTASVAYTYTVDPSKPNGATGSGNTNTVTTQVNNADLNILKAVDKVASAVGQIITYTLNITNVGNVDANAIVITDPIPNGTSYVAGSTSVTVPFTGDPTTTINLINPLTPGLTIIVTYKVKIDILPVPNPIPNAAVVNYTYLVDPTGNPVVGRNTSNTVNTSVGNVISNKTVDKSFAGLGDIITYTVTLNNTGITPVNDVLFQDPLPSGVNYLGSLTVNAAYTGIDPMSGLTITTINQGQTVTISWKVTVGNAIPNPNPVQNVGSVTIPGTVSVPTNTVTTQINNADLVALGNFVKAVDKAFADVGDIITYTITVKNTGNTIANNVVITDPIPNGTSYVSGSLTGSVAVSGTPAGGVSITNGIAPGQTITISYQVKVDVIPVPNPIPNTASVAYTYTVDPSKPNAASGAGNTNTVITQVNNANLVAPGNFVKAVDKEFANVGDILNYTITVKNTGNTIANNVVITDPIPNGTSYVGGSLTGSVPVSGTPAGGVSITNGIAAGQTITISYQVKVDVIPNSNPIPNTASVAYTYTVDPAKPNGATGSGNTNTVTTQINNANLVAPGNFVKAVDKAFADVEDILTYTISVNNTGNVIANNVVITDPIPSGTSYVTGSLTGSVPVTGTPAGGVSVTNGIASGQTVLISYRVKVDVIPVPNPIPNTASVAYTYTVDPAKPNGATGSGSTNTVTTQINNGNIPGPGTGPDGANKSADKSPTTPGQVITYTVKFKNTGNVAVNAVINDVLPVGTAFINGSVVVNNISKPGENPNMGINIGSVASNEVVTVEFKVTVLEDAPDPLVNTASIDYRYIVDPAKPPVEKITITNLVNISVLIPSLKIVKSDDRIGAIVGNIIRYTLLVTNNGEIQLDNVVIKDPLSADVSYANNLTVNNVSIPGDITVGVNIGSLPIGETKTVSFDGKVVSVPVDGIAENISTADYNYTVSGNSFNRNSVSNENKVRIYNPKLNTDKSVSVPSVKVGDIFKYTIIVENVGDINIDNVIIQDSLPVEFQVQEITVNDVLVSGDIQVGLNIGTIVVGGSKEIVVSIKALEEIENENNQDIDVAFYNVALINGTVKPDPNKPADPIKGSAADPIGITVYNPELTLTKSVDHKYVVVGEIVTYTIIAKNTGDVVLGTVLLDPVTVYDILGPELNFISGTITIDGVSYPNAAMLAGVEIGVLGIGESRIITFKAKVMSHDVDIIKNSSSATFGFVLPGINNPQTGESVSNNAEIYPKHAVIDIEKSSNTDFVVLGDAITYTVKLINSGDVYAKDVIFKDVLPSGVQLIDGSFKINGTAVYSVDLTSGINVGNIAVGQTITLQYTVKVIAPNCSLKIINSASVKFEYVLPDGSTGTIESEPSSTSSTVTTLGISNFRQISVEDYLTIPDKKPDMESINYAKGNILINRYHVIETYKSISEEGQYLSGYKIVIYGVVEENIEYIACDDIQSVHSAHYNIPFSTFIVLPDNFVVGSKIEVTGVAEDIYTDMNNSRELFSNATILINAKILSCAN